MVGLLACLGTQFRPPMNPRVSARARGCSGNFVPSLLLAFAANAAAVAVCATAGTATIDPVIAVIPDRPNGATYATSHQPQTGCGRGSLVPKM